MTTHRTLFLAIVALVALAACSGGSASPTISGSPTPIDNPSRSVAPSASPIASPAAATLLLKVTSEGGFINPAAGIAALPTVAVYTDGRILSPGIVPAVYPGPLVMPLAVHDVGAAGAAAIVAAIQQAGLDKPATSGPGVPGDSGTSVFTIVIDGATTTSRFAGGQPGQPGGPVASGDAERAAAFALLDRLLDPTDTWGGPPTQESLYVPTGYLVFVAPSGPPSDPQVSQSPAAWPLSTPLGGFGSPATPDRGIAGLRQGAVVGQDAVTLGPVLTRATALTAFTSAGAAYTLYVRPLLPDEAGG